MTRKARLDAEVLTGAFLSDRDGCVSRLRSGGQRRNLRVVSGANPPGSSRSTMTYDGTARRTSGTFHPGALSTPTMSQVECAIATPGARSRTLRSSMRALELRIIVL